VDQVVVNMLVLVVLEMILVLQLYLALVLDHTLEVPM
jgi:hypothetical protein